GGHTHLCQIEQKMACCAQTVINLERLVEIRIVDEPLPSDGGAWLLEVHAHHNAKVTGQLLNRLFQVSSVFESGARVVNRTWAYDHQQAGIFAFEDAADLIAEDKHRIRNFLGDGKFLFQKCRRQEDLGPSDSKVIR